MNHPPICRTLAALAFALAASAVLGQSSSLPPGTSDGAPPAPLTQPAAPKDTLPAPLAEAEAKLDAKDYAGARALLDAYLSAHPSDARALFDRGYTDDAEDRPRSAEGYYRKAIAADPQQFEAHLALGLLLATRSASDATAAAEATEAAEAKDQLEAALKLAPRPANPSAQAQAGRALAQLLVKTDPEGARQALLGALKLSAETTADTLLTAEIAESAGDPATAEQAYRGVLAEASSGSEDALAATGALAHLLIDGKHYPEAELLLRKTLARNSADPVLNTELAHVLMAENKPAEAVAVLENLHQQQPSNRAVSRMLADLYTQTGQPEKADPLYSQLVGAPDAQLLAARGDNLVRQKRFKEAIPVLEQAVKLDSADGNAWSSLAFAASEDHQAQLTLDALAMRSKVMSETPATYFLRATAYDTLHLTKRAVEMYKQFLAVAGGKFPDEEWEAKHRLAALDR